LSTFFLGRKIKGQVATLVGEVREIINLTRSEAKNFGLELFSPESASNKKGSPIAHADSASVQQKVTAKHSDDFAAIFFDRSANVTLIDALGLSDLSEATTSLLATLPWLRDRSRSFLQHEASLRTLRADNSKLQQHLKEQGELYEEQARRLQAELQQLTAANIELRKKEMHLQSSNSNSSGRLESEVKKERELKAALAEEVLLLRTSISHLEADLHDVNRRAELANNSRQAEVKII